MPDPTISVIIPVYNVEKFLGKCVESILAQTFEDFELICVNDGSTDSSLELLNTYAAKDRRVKVIDKENGGYGHSINRGLEAARGTWVSIVEPDDFIAPTMFESLLGISKTETGDDVDIVKSSYWLYFEDEEKGESFARMSPIMNNMPSRILEFSLKDHVGILYDHPCIWTALYRREFLEQHHIKMAEIQGAGWADNPWMYETLLQAKKIKWTPEPFYYYRQDNPDASSNLKDYRLPFDRLRDLWDILNRLGVEDERVIAAFYRRTFMYIEIVTVDHAFSESDPELRELIREALNRIDPDLLQRSKKQIPNRYLAYYDAFMGKSHDVLGCRDAEEDPAVTIVVPLNNDRAGLWPTVKSIAEQKGVSLEVIFANCSTSDASQEVAEGVCRNDKRFTVAPGVYSDVWNACSTALLMARGRYVHVVQPGVRYSNALTLGRIMQKLEEVGGADVAVCIKAIPKSFLCEEVGSSTNIAQSDVRVVEMKGDAAKLVSIGYPGLYNKLFRKELASQYFPKEIRIEDPIGVIATVAMLSHAQKAVIVSKCWMNPVARAAINKAKIRKEEDLISCHLECVKELWERADNIDDCDEAVTAEAYALRILKEFLLKLGVDYTDDKYFHKIEEVFKGRYAGFSPKQRGAFCNYLDYLWLSQAFSMGFERFVAMVYEYECKRSFEARIARDTARDNLALLKKEKAELEKKTRMIRRAEKLARRSAAAGQKIAKRVFMRS